MNWLAGVLVILFCSAHGLAAYNWSRRRRDLGPAPWGSRAGMPGWAVWAWVVLTQGGNFGGVRIIEEQTIGLPIAAVAMSGICTLTLGNAYWSREKTSTARHAVRFGIAVAILGLAAFSVWR